MTAQVVVVGGSGFVGAAIAERLRARGSEVTCVTSPRISGTVGVLAPSPAEVSAVADLFGTATCIVNAAGVSDAVSGDTDVLDGANGLLPGLLARACRERGLRFIHVSSAAVQGRRFLDSTDTYAPFSPYSRSKVIGERAVLAVGGDVCIFRPPGVHAPSRQVTRSIIRLARSPLSSVASPGTGNAPQAQLINVADAVAFLATHEGIVPSIVHLPSEGVSTARLLSALGQRHPVVLPRLIARFMVTATRAASTLAASTLHVELTGHVRRLEILWFGQEQAPSWLSTVGWEPPIGPEGWDQMSTVTHKEDYR